MNEGPHSFQPQSTKQKQLVYTQMLYQKYINI